MNKKILNIYIADSDIRHASEGDWLDGNYVSDMKNADVVILTGGQDINPAIYNEPKGSRTHFTSTRDEREIAEVKKAIELKKPIFGICRGAQLLCALAGGKLIQHMSHPSRHDITFYDGTKVNTTSCHHQMQYPFTINASDYTILAWAEGLSPVHLNGSDVKMSLPTVDDNSNVLKEPELVYYKKINALGIQGHPEWMNEKSNLCRILKKMIELMVDNNMEVISKYSLTITDLLESNLDNGIKKGVAAVATFEAEDS